MFSVIAPVYNVERYIAQCVESVLMQTETDWELILIDDGSTDKSGKICDFYASNNEKVKVIHQKNAGLSSARNIGIARAAGDYIVLLDSDDYLDLNALKGLKEIIGKEPYDLVINRVERFDEKEKKVYPCRYKFEIDKLNNISPVEIYEWLLNNKKFTFTAWIFVVRREFLEKHNLYFVPGLYHEDEMWTPYLILKAKRIGFNNNYFYYYRVNRDNSIMFTSNIQKGFSLEKIYKKLKNDAADNRFTLQEKRLLNVRSADIFINLLFSITDYWENSRFLELKNKIKGEHKSLLYRKSVKNYLVVYFINVFGLDCFLYILRLIKKMKR